MPTADQPLTDAQRWAFDWFTRNNGVTRGQALRVGITGPTMTALKNRGLIILDKSTARYWIKS